MGHDPYMFIPTHTILTPSIVIEINLQPKDLLRHCLKMAELILSERGYGHVEFDESKYTLKTSQGTVVNLDGSAKTLQSYELWLSPPFAGERKRDS